jgi:PAS domain S-box-containing protein
MARENETDDAPESGGESKPPEPEAVEAWLGTEASSPAGALAEMRRAFTTLLENIPGMAYRCANDRQFTMEVVSGKAETLTGYAPRELKNSRVVAYGDLIHPDDREGVWAKVQEAIDHREAFQLMYRIRDRTGEVRWVYEQGCGVFEEGELQALEGFISDITEQRRIEKRFSRAEQMNTLGRLMEYVADDFKDQLSLIMSYGAFVRDDLEAGSGNTDDIERLLAAAERASDLVQQLLKFARPDSADPERLSPNGFLDNHQEAIELVAGDEIDLQWELESDVGQTDIAPVHLKEALTSVVLNAREAIRDGSGTVEVRTGATTVGEGEAFEHPEMKPGEYVTIAVEDDGEGMDERVLERAVEPYFTTREEHPNDGRRGMGLTTSYALVRQAGGHLRIDSESGVGTVVTLYLPRIDDQDDQLRVGRSRVGDES